MNGREERAFADFLEAKLQVGDLTLTPLHGGCVARIYKAETTGRPPFFVKRRKGSGDCARQFLNAVPPHRLLPRPIFREPLAYAGEDVVCQEWQAGRNIWLEDMSDAQFASFLDGYAELAALMQRAPAVAEPVDYGQMLGEIRERMAGRPVARWLLRRILSLRVEDYAYADEKPLPVIHGDFHVCNYGFVGESLSAFFDFDALRRGGPADDLAYALADSYKKRSVGRKRPLLETRLRLAVARFGGPLAWRKSINRYRIQMVYRRVHAHRDGFSTVMKLAARDSRLCDLLKCMEGICA